MFDTKKLEEIVNDGDVNIKTLPLRTADGLTEVLAQMKRANAEDDKVRASLQAMAALLHGTMSNIASTLQMVATIHQLLIEKGIYHDAEFDALLVTPDMREAQPKGIHRDERPEITAAVHAKHGTSFKYHNTITADGRSLGGNACERIDIYSNEAEEWDARRTVHVLNGKVLDAQ